MKKEILVMKDVKLLGHSATLELQWSKRTVDETDKILDKENQRTTIMLDGVEGSDATKTFEKYIPLIVLEQAKEIGDLQSQINAISKECAQKVNIAINATTDQMILKTELLTAKESLKAHEENFMMAKSINDEIYAENKKLKSTIETILKDTVKLDENIIGLNAQIIELKKGN